ncbi:hypothetical protein SI65_04605 [Aspergillus cristatus]|uniref:Uncharacterized protein n=1 Tax=Aspergillus cristatus TaxID=573508 RepID=A0A1E3BF72_ASPCR|nr:hypothetical protein SI65_04605 [Aspergillus cristatus]
MPRTLPWLTGDNKDGGTGGSKRAIKPQPDFDSDLDRTPTATKKASKNKDIFRSSSPPASPTRQCPSEEYLIEGFDNDDIYMMVEDEFYAVAQSFTKHLHFAEYVRQAKEAKSQNASRIQDLARPTDGVTPVSEETKKKKEAESLAERQKKGLGVLDNNEGSREGKEEDDDDVFQDDSWAGTSLYDLMMSPRKSRALVGTQRIKSTTRAAAGFVQSSQNSSAGNGMAAPGSASTPLGSREQERRGSIEETASEDDDLDVQPTTTFKRRIEDIKTPKTEKSDESITPTPRRSISHAPNNPIKKPKPEPETKPTSTPSINTAGNKKRPSPSPSIPKPRRRMLFDDFDRLPEPAFNISMQEQKRKSSSSIEKSANGRDESKKKSRLNEVPMFVL